MNSLKTRVLVGGEGKILLPLVIAAAVCTAPVYGQTAVNTAPPSSTSTQQSVVTGRVTDQNGEPLPGATVAVTGQGVGAITDADGNFRITYPASLKDVRLTVSFVGMDSRTVAATPGVPVNVTLSTASTQLDEVVAIGYGSAKVRDLTGSVSRVTARDIQNTAMTNNVAGLLQGKAAGVNVMISSASPTSPVSVVIRGQSSLSGNGQPLWVIDGVPQYSTDISGDISNTLYNLNLNDVTAIDILKDASATAIYGSRAANGVVLVTTKSGAGASHPTVDFSARVGWQHINSNGFRSLDADEFIAFSKQANKLECWRNGGLSYYNKKYMDVNAFNAGIGATSQWNMDDITDDMWLANGYYDGHDNYWEAMTQQAFTQDYNVSLRGGAQSTSYFASVNWKDQDGIVKGSNAKTFGARFNFETTVRDRLKFGMNMNASARRANNKDNLIDKIIGFRPDFPMYTDDGQVFLGDMYNQNPLVELLNRSYSEGKNFTGISFLEYDILKCLKFRTTVNANYTNSDYDTFRRANYKGAVNSATRRNAQNSVVMWDNLLTFFKQMGRHDLTAMAGQSLERQSYKTLTASGSNFPDNDVLTDLGSAATKNSIGSEKLNSSLVSVFARAQYKYDDRYLFTATFRTDGSSRFGKYSRWGYFPSVAGGWIISNERFMEQAHPTLNYLKLRASWGKTGSQNLGYYDFTSGVGSNSYDGQPGQYPSKLGNGDLQWESQTQTDIGLDFGLLNDRLRGTFGWYRKYVDNLITARPVPTSSSFASTSQNVGAISNTGVEFDITYSILRNRDFTWEVNLNGAHNKGRLEKLNGGFTDFLEGSTYRLEEGGELGTFYGYVDAGRLYGCGEEVWGTMPIDPATGKPKNHRSATWALSAGDVYLVDLDGDGEITADGDRKILGSSNPHLFGGFGTTFIWKGLMLNLTFSYAIGGKRYWYDESQKNVLYTYNAPTFVLDSYTAVGPGATYPTTTHYGFGSNYAFSNRWLHDASYLRLGALNVSYKLPQQWFKRLFVKGLEASFQATNLFTVTRYPGMDPQGNFDTNNTALAGMGTDSSQYPSARTYSFGLKLTID